MDSVLAAAATLSFPVPVAAAAPQSSLTTELSLEAKQDAASHAATAATASMPVPRSLS